MTFFHILNESLFLKMPSRDIRLMRVSERDTISNYDIHTWDPEPAAGLLITIKIVFHELDMDIKICIYTKTHL